LGKACNHGVIIMEDTITLDREAFRTLASRTRVDILKSLDSRRKMLTELAKQFGMSPSTIKEHMDNLSGAGLVVQIDDGHKWKYYELTRKGREILHPEGTRVYIILGLSLFALLFTAWDLFSDGVSYATRNGEMLAQAGKDAIGEAVPMAGGQVAAPLTQALPYAHILGIAVFTAIFGISLGYLVARRMGTPGFLD
jgi:DNA-binding transcriptional ArsR family regulator